MIQNRSIVKCILLTIITCGLYMIYWYVKLTDETNMISTQNQTASGGMAFLFSLITCGIYTLYWMYKQGAKIDEAKMARGIQSSSTGILYLILAIFNLGFVSYCLMQHELNQLA